MKKEKVYLYPSCPKEGYGNPYCLNFKDALKNSFELLDADNKVTTMKSLTFLRYSFEAEIFILNWIENTIYLRLGFIQFCLVFLSFFVIKLRKKRIVWIFHNINPHEGGNFFTKFVMSYLFKHASLIVSHSKEAYSFAQKKALCKVMYHCHPIKELNIHNWNGEKLPCDILIWGAILPYKGVLEFLENCSAKLENENILILGKCQDHKLAEAIYSYNSKHIRFENRRADFSEIAYYAQTCKFVLFPYVGESISSSGVLMDTIVMGGTPIGPNKGAFKDLQKEGICETYNDYNELLTILTSCGNISDDLKKRFMEENTWSNFVSNLSSELNSMQTKDTLSSY